MNPDTPHVVNREAGKPDLLGVLQEMAQKWKREGDFLNGPKDHVEDRIAPRCSKSSPPTNSRP